MSSSKCPFCKSFFTHTQSTVVEKTSFFEFEQTLPGINYTSPSKDQVTVIHMKCPNCNQYIVRLEGIGSLLDGLDIPIYPRSDANLLPEYVPEPIRQNYEEAYLIADLSPKASATLSRRCLQTMIRDFFKVQHGKLQYEINQIKEKIAEDSFEALIAVKSVGNVGAHPTVDPELDIIIDIEPGEAKQLLELVEMFVDEWYVARHNREHKIAKIKMLSVEKGA